MPVIVLLTLLFFTPAPWAAAQFQATVDSNQVSLNDTIALKLELTEATAKGVNYQPPDISQLQKQFAVHDQQKFESYNLSFGETQRRLGWRYMLKPKKTGMLTIPALALKTTNGTLHSQPIQINVTAKQSNKQDDTRLEVIVSNQQPYLHQPIYYTLRLYHHGELRDLQPLPPSDKVITEQVGKLSNRREIVNGQEMIVSEINYLLTSLRSGQLSWQPGGQMKGEKLEKTRNFFDNSLFDSGFLGFTHSRPITVRAPKLTLEVQAPPADLQQPWLPLKALQLNEEWESAVDQAVQVGVPLVRTLTLVAEGMGGQALPKLEHFMQNNADFRIRSPKPEVERQLMADGKTPFSRITQTFSLIPVKTGQLQIPALRIPWWDLAQKTLKWAELPAQTIQVISNQNYVHSTTLPPKTTQTPVPTVYELALSQYIALALAVVALLIALSYSGYQRWPQKVNPQRNAPTPSLKRQLQTSSNVAQLQKSIQDYAHHHWQLPPQMALRSIAKRLANDYEYSEYVVELLNALEAARYGQHALDLAHWKMRFQHAVKALKPKSSATNKQSMPPLNPL